MSNQQKYDERMKRVHDVVELKTPDRVPFIDPMENMFAYFDKGLSMADVLYDVNKAKEAIKSYINEFEPDTGHGLSALLEGQGPMLEKSKCKMWRWAGMPGNVIPNDSIHQFNEYPLLEEEEFDELLKSRGTFGMKKMLPRVWGIMEPAKHFNFDMPFVMKPELNTFAFAFANPQVREMVDGLAELAGMWGKYWGEVGAFKHEIEEMGYPIPWDIFAMVPFDFYSDYLRGTMATSTDLYDRPDEIYEFVWQQAELGVRALKSDQWGRLGCFVEIFMHKGMDGFLSDEHYEKFYWRPFMKIIDAILEKGMIPYLFTEGKYSSRLKFLKELPKGKTLIHFENVDMVKAKRELEGTACVTGNFPAYLLLNGTKEQVITEVKRQLDNCAAGGGYIFSLDGSFVGGKRENVAALYETIKTYGKY